MQPTRAQVVYTYDMANLHHVCRLIHPSIHMNEGRQKSLSRDLFQGTHTMHFIYIQRIAEIILDLEDTVTCDLVCF